MSLVFPTFPPLRRRITFGFLSIVGLYAFFSGLMIVVVYLAGQSTPELIHRNYDSIVYMREMDQALEGFVLRKEYRKLETNKLKVDFEVALAAEGQNITEPGEAETVRELRTRWSELKKHPDSINPEEFQAVKAILTRLIVINEKAMFDIAQQTSSMAHNVFIFGILFFAISLISAIIVSDRVANRLSLPLKKIAEVLRTRPQLGTKLKLPAPTTLETHILSHELIQLWNRLNYLNDLNVEEIASQRNQLTTILSSVDDAILVVDNNDRIVHLNQGLTDIIHLPISDVLGRSWSDLPSSDPNYFKLREAFKQAATEEKTIEIDINGEKRFLSVQSRPITNQKNSTIARLFLLHDVSEQRRNEKLKREFIAVLSHELKTPLQSLSLCAEILVGYKNHLDNEGKEVVDTLNEDVLRIRSVANDFVQVGLDGLQSLRLKLEDVNLKVMLPEWLKSFQILAKDRGLNLRVTDLTGSATALAV